MSTSDFYVAPPAVWSIPQESYAHKPQAGGVTPDKMGTDSSPSPFDFLAMAVCLRYFQNINQ
jgi:hypothetical protein